MLDYAPLQIRVKTPRLELVGAGDDMLEQLIPLVREGKAFAEPAPYDDPMSFYESDPETRVNSWLQGVWRARGRFTPSEFRLGFAVLVDGRAVGMQDLIAEKFDTCATVLSFSWLSTDVRGRGLGTEMRSAMLHLAFAGLDAREAASDAFTANIGSNRVSESLGYEPNGVEWDTRRGDPALLQRWRLTRQAWQRRRRDDIELSGVEEFREMLAAQ
ncbi:MULTISPECIES: GNAT family protein [unclassified Brevibacterium]|uniref:GNAT family N-acetyltransferase n=1 Tax=unclassified Brevibacterium TaxID=2614124 RepID=UPI001E52D64B|nr:MULTISPECIES: GNAT family protein [unclassified Brevibacterium]MCD1286428.1 GNAT family N-acetyltransferase [Brevibacterium sp. CCUG 69071]MDK8433797.1 GNAT family protein [Brevibacterium sp. H-BE7]